MIKVFALKQNGYLENNDFKIFEKYKDEFEPIQKMDNIKDDEILFVGDFDNENNYTIIEYSKYYMNFYHQNPVKFFKMVNRILNKD